MLSGGGFPSSYSPTSAEQKLLTVKTVKYIKDWCWEDNYISKYFLACFKSVLSVSSTRFGNVGDDE